MSASGRKSQTGSICRSMLQKLLVQTAVAVVVACVFIVKPLICVFKDEGKLAGLFWLTSLTLMLKCFIKWKLLFMFSTPGWGSVVSLFDGFIEHARSESERCLRHELNDDVTDGKRKLLPVCVLACWWVYPCSIYNSWGFTHAFESWMSLAFSVYSYGTHLMSSLWWEVVTCPIFVDSTRLELLLCLLCQRHTPISMIAQRDNMCRKQWVVFLGGFYFRNYAIMYEDAYTHIH